MPRILDFVNLRECLDNYRATFLFIRRVSSRGGGVEISENLDGRVLDFTQDDSGLHLLIDSNEVFCFSLNDDGSQKGFSLAYERITPTDDGIGRMVMLPRGVEPYDLSLPEPRSSFLTKVLDGYLLEISFAGRVDIRVHSWWHRPYWKYWVVTKPKGKKKRKKMSRRSKVFNSSHS